MHYIYVLQSEKDMRFYIGYSKDLKLRFEQHNKGLVRSTRDRRPSLLWGMPSPKGCNKAREVSEIFLWKDVPEEKAQILFNRVNKAQLLLAQLNFPFGKRICRFNRGYTLDYLALNWDYSWISMCPLWETA